jgi:protein-S-isoprenylcysteine O-methyltransferase Ste14
MTFVRGVVKVEDQSADNPGVRVHPPFFFLGGLLISAGLQALRPLPIFDNATGRLIGGIIAVLGIAFIAWGRWTMVAQGTNVNPTLPVTTIVTTGPFRFTRNPLYLGLTIAYLGVTLAGNTWWSVMFLVPILLVMHFDVVLREERYLTRKFGDIYRQYCSRVRRYF